MNVLLECRGLHKSVELPGEPKPGMLIVFSSGPANCKRNPGVSIQRMGYDVNSQSYLAVCSPVNASDAELKELGFGEVCRCADSGTWKAKKTEAKAVVPAASDPAPESPEAPEEVPASDPAPVETKPAPRFRPKS